MKKVLERLSDEGLYSEEQESFNEYLTRDDVSKMTNTKEFIGYLCPNSTINLETDGTFDETLLNTFFVGLQRDPNLNEHSRQALVNRFSRYLLSTKGSLVKPEVIHATDPEFIDIEKDSVEYKNVAYTLYKSLTKNAKHSLVSIPLTLLAVSKSASEYRITLKESSALRTKEVNEDIKNFIAALLNGEDGLTSKVEINYLDYTHEITIYPEVKSESKSLGDVLRSPLPMANNKPLLSDFIKDEGTPLILGVDSENKPYMIDLDQETSINIIGGSGSGKSWLAYTTMVNLLISNSPEDLKLLIFDAKNAPIWQQLALAPHVLGYHSDIETYIDSLEELIDELDRRQKQLELLEEENWSELRKTYKKSGDYASLAKNPNLVVVVDELTFTMNVLADKEDKSGYNRVLRCLELLTQIGRAVGIHLIAIAQTIDEVVMSDVLLANASVTIGLKINKTLDYTKLYHLDDLEGIDLPTHRGEFLTIQNDYPYNILKLKTLTLGTNTQSEMQKLIRVLSLDWENQKLQEKGYQYGEEYIKQTNLVESFNHKKYLQLAKDALENDFILSSRIQSTDEYNDYLLTHKSIKDISGKGLKRLTDLIKQLNK